MIYIHLLLCLFCGSPAKSICSSSLGMGEVTVHTPRNCDSRFEPEFIKKCERVMMDSVSDRIIGLYALANNTREISDRMEENLGYPRIG